jgi:hypothetical protein
VPVLLSLLSLLTHKSHVKDFVRARDSSRQVAHTRTRVHARSEQQSAPHACSLRSCQLKGFIDHISLSFRLCVCVLFCLLQVRKIEKQNKDRVCAIERWMQNAVKEEYLRQ